MTFSQNQILTSELHKLLKENIYNTDSNRHGASMWWCSQVMLAERSAKHHKNDKITFNGGYELLYKAVQGDTR